MATGWEVWGAMRRDCVPHRGPLLAWLGWGSLLCGLAGVAGPFGLVGAPLGLLAWVLARGDLAAMEEGLMDAGGAEETYLGRDAGKVGALLSFLSLPLTPFQLVLYVLLLDSAGISVPGL